MDMNAKVPDEYMIPIENLMNPRALDFHAESEFIYFADATSYIIGRQKIDGSERDTIVKEGQLTHSRVRRNTARPPFKACNLKDLAKMQEMYKGLTFRGPSLGRGGARACSRFLSSSLVPLRDPRRGGDRRGLDGRQPVLDRRRTQENHQRGSSGKGLTDPQNSHRGKNDSPPSHRGGSSERVGSGAKGGCEGLCCSLVM